VRDDRGQDRWNGDTWPGGPWEIFDVWWRVTWHGASFAFFAPKIFISPTVFFLPESSSSFRGSDFAFLDRALWDATMEL
jgi:hypothetical protein